MHPRAFRPTQACAGAHSVDSAFDPNSFDFTSYLGRRLGVSPVLAAELLGSWLKTYERRAASSEPPSEASSEPPSGTHAVVEGASARAPACLAGTGTEG